MTEGLKNDLEKINELDCSGNILYFDRARIDWIDYREVIIMANDDKMGMRVAESLITILVDDNSFLATATIIGGFQNSLIGFAPGENLKQKYDFHSLFSSATAAHQAYSRVYNAAPLNPTEKFQGYTRDAAFHFAFFRRFFAKTTATLITH
jgi:hypothetical protein